MWMIESYIEGPRWIKFGDSLRKLVLDMKGAGYNIKIDYVNVSKGWIRETTYFSVSGSKEAIEEFRKIVLSIKGDNG